jgi:murein L,D-transpeptidase YcbB/YkuD
VSTIVFNPKWNVPEKIMNEDIIPKVIANPNYLAEENIKIYNKWAKNAYEIKPESIDE